MYLTHDSDIRILYRLHPYVYAHMQYHTCCTAVPGDTGAAIVVAAAT